MVKTRPFIGIADISTYWAPPSNKSLSARVCQAIRQQTVFQDTLVPFSLPPEHEEWASTACLLWLATVLLPAYAQYAKRKFPEYEQLTALRETVTPSQDPQQLISELTASCLNPLMCQWWSTVLPTHVLHLAERHAIGAVYQGCCVQYPPTARSLTWMLLTAITVLEEQQTDVEQKANALRTQTVAAQTLAFLQKLKEPSCQSYHLI